jgi:hypothetical protein
LRIERACAWTGELLCDLELQQISASDSKYVYLYEKSRNAPKRPTAV